jgi:hypothetical protein
MKTNKVLGGLVGKWQTQDEDSSAIIEVTEKGGKPRVTVVDKFDGEKFKVTDVRFEKSVLSYACYVPSTKCKTKHKLRLTSKNHIEQELTFIEPWKRIIEVKTNT